MGTVQLFVPTFRTEEVLVEIRECLDNGWTGAGYKTVEFEDAWKRYTGLPHAHFLNSATAGLHLAVKILKRSGGWQDGDEVVTTPLTFVSTNHAILYERLTPVFGDVDEHLCLSPSSVLRHIGSRTRAVMFVGIGGNVGMLQEVSEICRDRGLALVLDAAHMAGTRWRGSHVGREADVAVFSYHSVKNLPTADSGMVCFQDPALDAAARRLSWMGIDKGTYARSREGYSWEYDVEETGYKYHGNSVMAAMALVGLRHLDEDNDRRRQISALYDAYLPLEVGRVPVRFGCESARHLYQVILNTFGDPSAYRRQVVERLNSAGVFPGVHYRLNTEYAPYVEQAGFNARYYSDRLLSLPLHLRMADSDVDRVCSSIRSAL